MKRLPLRPAFVTNELLVVIAMLAIWLAASLPVYARVIQHLTKQGKPVGLVQQLQALGIASVGGAVMLVIIFGVFGGLILIGEQAGKRLGRPRK